MATPTLGPWNNTPYDSVCLRIASTNLAKTKENHPVNPHAICNAGIRTLPKAQTSHSGKFYRVRQLMHPSPPRMQTNVGCYWSQQRATAIVYIRIMLFITSSRNDTPDVGDLGFMAVIDCNQSLTGASMATIELIFFLQNINKRCVMLNKLTFKKSNLNINPEVCFSTTVILRFAILIHRTICR